MIVAAPEARIVVVEDDATQREPLARFLAALGHDVRPAATCAEARRLLDAGGVDVIVSDLRLPDEDGLALLRWTRARHPLAAFLLVTAYGTIEGAVDAMQGGAVEFLTKPLDLDVLESRLGTLLARRRLDRELTDAAGRRAAGATAAPSPAAPPGLVAASPGMRQLLATVQRVAPTHSTVLVTGESGTGKEVVAELLHRWSRRSGGPFVRVNCGALAESLLASELFGHVRGAFTGAERDRAGLFDEASGGTLLLDEIGEVSPALQVKLLRVLQEREVLPVGAARPVPVDVRVVAATNRDLADEVRAGRFRQDLLFRLNAITLRVPPLRERREDTAALIPVLLARFADEAGVAPRRLSRDAHDALLAHPFPGNVRELQNVLYRATVLAAGEVIRTSDLAESLRATAPVAGGVPEIDPSRPLSDVLGEIERTAMQRALRDCGGVQARAARALGMHPRVFRYKMRQHGIGDAADATESSHAPRDRRADGEP